MIEKCFQKTIDYRLNLPADHSLYQKSIITNMIKFNYQSPYRYFYFTIRAKSGEDEDVPLMKTKVLRTEQSVPDVNSALGVGQIAELEAELREYKVLIGFSE
jgi:hypothetical protein